MNRKPLNTKDGKGLPNSYGRQPRPKGKVLLEQDQRKTFLLSGGNVEGRTKDAISVPPMVRRSSEGNVPKYLPVSASLQWHNAEPRYSTNKACSHTKPKGKLLGSSSKKFQPVRANILKHKNMSNANNNSVDIPEKDYSKSKSFSIKSNSIDHASELSQCSPTMRRIKYQRSLSRTSVESQESSLEVLTSDESCDEGRSHHTTDNYIPSEKIHNFDMASNENPLCKSGSHQLLSVPKSGHRPPLKKQKSESAPHYNTDVKENNFDVMWRLGNVAQESDLQNLKAKSSSHIYQENTSVGQNSVIYCAETKKKFVKTKSLHNEPSMKVDHTESLRSKYFEKSVYDGKHEKPITRTNNQRNSRSRDKFFGTEIDCKATQKEEYLSIRTKSVPRQISLAQSIKGYQQKRAKSASNIIKNYQGSSWQEFLGIPVERPRPSFWQRFTSRLSFSERNNPYGKGIV